MAKKLQLAVAELTDVGRRRERNQDNVTHLVPSDEEVLEEKGALFVVCDGMGGHAAGEVAAEFGVNTIRDVYFSTHDDDIISGLANAVKVANETIYSYARRHPEMTGMGTTCVALVTHGGRGYFLNIGDSRAYVVRDGAMRQITLDHSWVAEQVRAGLLTDEQARTHAHRNVITRSLGTQPNVSADLFIETLRDGDRVLLCSDGLHGYVEEAEIERELLDGDDPEIAVHRLIDMANTNGGPDNITALLVHMLEVPAATGEIMLPGGIPATEDQVATQPIPVVTGKSSSRARGGRLAQAARGSSGLAQAPIAKRRGARRAAVVALRLLAVAALLVLAAGIWDFGFGPYAATRAAAAQLQTDVKQAQTAARQAPSQDPAQALVTLAAAQQHVVGDLQSPQLDSQSRAAAQDVLDTQLAPAVRSTVQRYNAAALITPVPLNGAVPYSVFCAAPGAATPTALTTVDSLASVTPPAGAASPSPVATVYAISGGDLEQITVPLDANGQPAVSAARCSTIALPGVSTTLALAADGPKLYTLSQLGGGYAVFSILPNGANPDGSARVKIQKFFAIPTPHAESPTALAADGSSVYVGYKGGATGSGGIWLFSGKTPKAPTLTAQVPQPMTSLAAANGTVYALLADGSLGQLDTSHTYLQLPLQVAPPITSADPTAYTSATPVPTAPAGATPTAAATSGTVGTLFGAGSSLVVDPAQRTGIILGDPASSRVMRLAASQPGPGLSVNAQYVYGAPLTNVKALALAPAGTTLTVFAWSGSQLVTFSIPEPPTGG